MITAIIVTATIVGSLGYALGIGRRDSSIVRRPYNNRYNAASGAREEMIAHGRSTEEVAAELGCDSLHYLSLESVYEAIGATRATHCDACFSGSYPLDGSHGANGKYALEERSAQPPPLVRA